MWSATVIVLSLSIFKFALNENSISESKLSLANAARNCTEQGLILESDETMIQSRIKNGNPEVWIGKYETFTGWAYIKDCVEIKIDPMSKPLNVSNGTENNICQGLCKNKTYFGVKNKFCICLDDIRGFPKCKCNIDDCVMIWENLPTQNVSDINSQCIIAERCENNTLVRKYVGCDFNYLTMCDDGRYGNYSIINNQQESELFCFNGGSFLKWYNNSICRSLLGQRWTSGRRHLFNKTLRKNDDVQTQQPLFCYSTTKNKVTKHAADDCKGNNQCHFLCREENSNDELESAIIIYPPQNSSSTESSDGELITSTIYPSKNGSSTESSDGELIPSTIYPSQNGSSTDNINGENKPAHIYPPQTDSSTVGTVVGSVIAVIAVIVLITVVVIFLKRRAKKKNDAPSKGKNAKTVSNLGYNFHVTQSNKIKTQRTDYDYPRVAGIINNKNLSVNYSLAKPIEDENGGDYSFAQPIDSDGGYAYNSDYDHFNNPAKTTNDDYDDYRSAGQAKKMYDDKRGTYDHLSSFERKTNDEESCLNSNYDHLPNITGSDPTYDVSGDVIHDDSDKYDHLPSNFNADTSSDYQSTRLFTGKVKDDAYDHFEM